MVGKFTDIVAYMNVAQVFIEYPLKHLSVRLFVLLLFSSAFLFQQMFVCPVPQTLIVCAPQMREVSVMLNDILKHVSAEHNYERVQPQLQAIVHRILAHEGALEKVLAMEAFMGLVDLFQKDAKQSVSLAILDAFSRYCLWLFVCFCCLLLWHTLYVFLYSLIVVGCCCGQWWCDARSGHNQFDLPRRSHPSRFHQ